MMSKSDNKRQFQAVVSVLRFELEITTIAVMSALVFGVVGFSIGFILLFAGLLLAIPLVVIYAFALLDNANAESYFRQWTIGAGALNIFFAFILWLFGVIEVNDRFFLLLSVALIQFLSCGLLEFMSVDKKCLVPVESVCVRTPLMNEKSESVSVEFPTSSTTLSPGKLPRVLKHYKSSTTITSENKSVPEKSQHPTANELLMNDLDTPNQSVTSINEPIEMSSKR